MIYLFTLNNWVLAPWFEALTLFERICFLVYWFQIAWAIGFAITHFVWSYFTINRILKFTFSGIIPFLGYYYLIKWLLIFIKYDWDNY